MFLSTTWSTSDEETCTEWSGTVYGDVSYDNLTLEKCVETSRGILINDLYCSTIDTQFPVRARPYM